MSKSEENTAQSAPINCAKGCGFFGNPLTENMCSKCYKETQSTICPPTAAPPAPLPDPKTPADPPKDPTALPPPAANEPAPPLPTPAPTASPALTASPAPTPSTTSAPSTSAATSSKGGGGSPPKKSIQKNKKRCLTCKKKVGLMGFECKCDFIFCAEHRYAEKHQCTYDYMTEQRAKLSTDNPTVKAQKLTRI